MQENRHAIALCTAAVSELNDEQTFHLHFNARRWFQIVSPKDDNPNSISAYSLVEATMALYDDGNRAVVVFDVEGLSGHVLEVMQKVERDLKKRFPTAAILDANHLVSHLVARLGELD